jgi:hypothetical protein
MTGGTKGGAQRACNLRPRCFREVDPETTTHIHLPQNVTNTALRQGNTQNRCCKKPKISSPLFCQLSAACPGAAVTAGQLAHCF